MIPSDDDPKVAIVVELELDAVRLLVNDDFRRYMMSGWQPAHYALGPLRLAVRPGAGHEIAPITDTRVRDRDDCDNGSV